MAFLTLPTAPLGRFFIREVMKREKVFLYMLASQTGRGVVWEEMLGVFDLERVSFPSPKEFIKFLGHMGIDWDEIYFTIGKRRDFFS